MFLIPSLKDHMERVRQAFRSYLPGSDGWIWPNNVGPTGKVFAGLIHEVFGFADYIQKQKFALTADSENLDLHGEEFGLARRSTAPSRGFVTVTTPAALAIDVAAILRRADGVEFRALAGGSLPGAGTIDVEVIATTEGKVTSTIAATPLEIVSGFTGDDTTTAVAGVGGILGGKDIEDDETFRARILFRRRNPPHGGAAADYVFWASEVAGVTRVFVERLWGGVGTVRVFPLMDDIYIDGIPGLADVLRVHDFIETVRPAGAMVTIAAPEAVPVPVVIDGLLPFTVDVEEAVLAELRAAFRRLSRVAGADSAIGGMPYLASPTSFSRSWIWQAVANATGEQRHIITSPPADIVLTPGQMATLGAVTFT
jgi:uncharacterized phage protein gp47/JayE